MRKKTVFSLLIGGLVALLFHGFIRSQVSRELTVSNPSTAQPLETVDSSLFHADDDGERDWSDSGPDNRQSELTLEPESGPPPEMKGRPLVTELRNRKRARLERALERDPQNTEALFRLATMEFEDGNLHRAEELLLRSLRVRRSPFVVHQLKEVRRVLAMNSFEDQQAALPSLFLPGLSLKTAAITRARSDEALTTDSGIRLAADQAMESLTRNQTEAALEDLELGLSVAPHNRRLLFQSALAHLQQESRLQAESALDLLKAHHPTAEETAFLVERWSQSTPGHNSGVILLQEWEEQRAGNLDLFSDSELPPNPSTPEELLQETKKMAIEVHFLSKELQKQDFLDLSLELPAPGTASPFPDAAALFEPDSP